MHQELEHFFSKYWYPWAFCDDVAILGDSMGARQHAAKQRQGNSPTSANLPCGKGGNQKSKNFHVQGYLPGVNWPPLPK